MKFARHGIPFIIVNHVYDSMSMFSPKEISGGGGVKYNASIILQLGKGVLKDDEGKKKAEKKNVDPSRLGVTIFVNPYKQRFARPIKVQIHIPYYKPPNPYVGLEPFVDWDHCGIVRGKALTEKEYLKLTTREQNTCKPFEIEEDNKKTGEREKVTYYAFPKKTALTLVVKHLGGEIPLKELFSDKVFTPEVLQSMDEHIIKPTFQLPDLYSLEDEMEDLQEILEGEDVDRLEEIMNEDGED
jgi:hypothetical protein